MRTRLLNYKTLAVIGSILLFVMALVPVMAKTSINCNLQKGDLREFELTYKVEVPAVPAGTKRLDMWIPYPVNDEDQTIKDVKIDSPVPVRINYDSDYGNGIIFLTIENPQVGGFSFTAHYTVERWERTAGKLNLEEKTESLAENPAFSRYLQPSSKAVINDTVRKLTAEAIKGKNTDLEKARAIYDFIFNKMDYNKQIPGWGNGDVNRLCLSISGEEGKGYGNCTDFHSLYGSMMRVAGIPVKFEMGYPLKPGKNQELTAGGYHCWAKLYISGYGWIPVDISEARKDPSKKEYFWGSICKNRIKFSTGRDIVLSPAQAGEALNYFGPDPYIELDGVAFNGFTRKIGYKNL